MKKDKKKSDEKANKYKNDIDHLTSKETFKIIKGIDDYRQLLNECIEELEELKAKNKDK